MAAVRVIVCTAVAACGLVLTALAVSAMAGDRAALTGFGVTTPPTPGLTGVGGDRTARTPTPRTTSSTALGGEETAGAPAATLPTTGTVPALTPAEPVRISIPPLAVTADVVPVTTSSGTLDVPTDPRQVGWWTGGALAGAAHGSVVLDGHIDSAVSGLGALFRLGTLHDGDPILLTTTTSQQQRYAVIGRRVYVKTDGLPADLFTTTGPARLVIITCGGPFDHQTGSYLDNVVVFAAPS